jgi:hypothetical protein
MSTRTDWGIFNSAGQPVALGDDHAKWKCPQQQFEPVGYEHTITGEWIDEGFAAVPCPFKLVGPKLERCEKCGMVFKYP